MELAIIGTSAIMTTFLAAVKQCDDIHLKAVYSRSLDKARAFSQRYGAELAFDDLQAMADCPEIDAVYIASPNSAHCGQALTCLRAGKAVLCEKTMGANAWEAREMFDTAHKQGVLLMEAVRSLYDPGFLAIKELLPKLGAIHQVQFSMCQYSGRYDKYKAGEILNIFKTSCAAGALTDIGVYCVEPLVALFGRPEKIQASAIILEKARIDGAGVILADYPWMTAVVTYSKMTDSQAPCEILGEKGTLSIDSIHTPRNLTLRYLDGRMETIQPVSDGTGGVGPANMPTNMIYEIQTFSQYYKEGVIRCANEDTTLLSLELMDEVRAQAGIHFPMDRRIAE